MSPSLLSKLRKKHIKKFIPYYNFHKSAWSPVIINGPLCLGVTGSAKNERHRRKHLSKAVFIFCAPVKEKRVLDDCVSTPRWLSSLPKLTPREF